MLTSVWGRGKGAQPSGLRTPRLRQVRLQVENTHLLLTGRSRYSGRRGGEAVGCGWGGGGEEKVKYESQQENLRKHCPLLEMLHSVCSAHRLLTDY